MNHILKQRLILVTVSLILCLSKGIAQITETGFNDDFSSSSFLSKKSAVLNNECGDDSFACYELTFSSDTVNSNYSLNTNRDSEGHKLNIDFHQSYAVYHPLDFTFGTYCENDSLHRLSIDLSNNSNLSFGIELIDNYNIDTTGGIHLEIYLEDVNGQFLKFDDKVTENSEDFFNYWIGITHGTNLNVNVGYNKQSFLPSDGLINFSYDFSQAWSSDKYLGGQPDSTYNFDISQVVKLGFMFRGTHLNPNDDYHSYPIKISLEVSDLSLGGFSSGQLGTNCEDSIILGAEPILNSVPHYTINHLSKSIFLNEVCSKVQLINTKGVAVVYKTDTDHLQTHNIIPGLYLLKTNLFTERVFIP